MATYSREYLSGSSNGRPIEILGTATIIHTPHATAKDEIYLWVANTTASAVTLNVYINDGSIDDPDDYYVKATSIPGNSPPIPILTGQTITVAANVVTAHASSAAALSAYGYVNRIT